MPLLLTDLDNTLVDRDAAFRAGAAAFLSANALPATDLAWLAELDDGGYTPRDVLAAALSDRYDGVSAETIRTLLDHGAADRVVLTGETEQALLAARAAGWTCVIVTNGRTAQQEAKICRTGLDRLVRGWVVSEAAGHKKPAPEIFHAAADLAGIPLAGAWVVGDSPRADVAGAVALGLPSAWISNGRTWSQPAYEPTETAADFAAAVRCVLAAGR